jgi:hypothetical protein
MSPQRAAAQSRQNHDAETRSQVPDKQQHQAGPDLPEHGDKYGSAGGETRNIRALFGERSRQVSGSCTVTCQHFEKLKHSRPVFGG